MPFTQKTLEDADRWVSALDRRAAAPRSPACRCYEGVKQAPDGVIVLLTDGQVGQRGRDHRPGAGGARSRRASYSFGIGTNVSDFMLRELSKKSGGAIEMIHPGERIDEKVVAQFARAMAARGRRR